MKTILFTLLFGALSFFSIGQINFNTSNSGIIDNDIYSITIDANNNKWIATWHGASKFDGTNWTNYTKINSGIASDSLSSIAIDLQGNVWFGTIGSGVSKFDGSNWTTFTSSDGLAGDDVRGIAIDNLGNKWFATINGVSKFNDTIWSTFLPGEDVLSVAVDLNGNVWIGEYNQGIKMYNDTLWTTFNNSFLNDSTILSISIDNQNNKWFGTQNGGYTIFDDISWTNSLLAGFSIFSIQFGQDGHIWFGTENGVKEFYNNIWTNYLYGPIRTVVIDSQNNKWIGGIGNGANGLTLISDCGIPMEQSICFVEFDQNSLKNKINWSSVLPSNIDSIRVYNEISTGVWDLLGSVSSSQSYFIDQNSSPLNQSYSYKISMCGCGNESALSQAHTTITLFAAYDIGTNTYGFTWSPYIGLTVPNYYLYGVSASGTETMLGSVPGNQYFYNIVNPFPGFIKYFVGFNTPACDTKANYLVKSNYVSSITSINEYPELISPIVIYPNPVSDFLIINSELEIEKIEIRDIANRMILNTKTKLINCSEISNGIYFINIYSTQGSLSYKFIKE